jgi:DNA invertase Pin-like site-specific DNA recombinase
VKVALYARVSTDDKDQNPETQLLILREYCELYGHEIIAVFLDEGRSGKDPERPAFKDMMEEAGLKTKRRFQAIICLRLDRFMRSALYGLQATQRLHDAECGLIFVKDQIDTTTPGGRFFYTLMLAFAQMEREHHGERVAEGIHRRLKEGGTWGKGRRRDVNVGLAVELLRTGNARSISDVAKQLKVPASTLVDHAREEGIDLTEYTPRKNKGGA